MDIIKKDLGGNSQIVLYQPNETISIEVKLDVEYDTVWLTQAQMVELFASSKANISEHISNIFQKGELQPESTVRKFRIVRKEGAHGGENGENSGEIQLSERQALIYNMLKVNGEKSAFIASEICTQDIKYLRKKHRRFAYIRKKQYFCRRLRKLPLLHLSIKSAICIWLVVGGGTEFF